MFIEILFKIVLFKGGVLIYAEHCTFFLDFEPILEHILFSFVMHRITARHTFLCEFVVIGTTPLFSV